MQMTNDDIEKNVRKLADSYVAGIKMRPQDIPLLDAGIALITNVLQNLNDIAAASRRR